MNDIFYTFKRQQLLDKLESLRPELKKLDAERKKQHAVEEKEFLQAFRAHLRRRIAAAKDALKWDYEKSKSMHFEPKETIEDGDEPFYRRNQPHCPEELVIALDRQISLIQNTVQERFRISQNGNYHRIWALITATAPKDKLVC